MRTVLGWAVALVAGAFMGAAVYQAVLSDPLPRKAAAEVVPSVQATPEPAPTIYRTEVREIVDPTPTVTVVDEVVVEKTAKPAPRPAVQVRSSSGTKAQPQKSSSRRDDSSGKKAESEDGDDDDHEKAESEDREDPKDDHAEEDRPEDRHPEVDDD